MIWLLVLALGALGEPVPTVQPASGAGMTPALLSDALPVPSSPTVHSFLGTEPPPPPTEYSSPKTWTELKDAIGEIESGSSGTFVLPSDFDCSDYNSIINIKGNVTVHGNGAVCDAGQKDSFFFLFSEQLIIFASLTLDWMTLKNGYSPYAGGGAITNGALECSLLHLSRTTFEHNTASGGVSQTTCYHTMH
jgi:hypothetical protein